MARSRRANVLLLAAVLIGLGLPAAAYALPVQNSILAATSPQITQISIPIGAGRLHFD